MRLIITLSGRFYQPAIIVVSIRGDLYYEWRHLPELHTIHFLGPYFISSSNTWISIQIKIKFQTNYNEQFMYLVSLFRKNIVLYAFLVYIFAPVSLQGQSIYKRELQVSIFNNAIAFPFSGKAGIIHSPIHPGFTLAIASRINRHPHHQLFVHAKFAYLYQKWVQHGIHLYPELGYRYAFVNGFAIEADLGVGYMHAFSDLQQFKLNAQGEYKRVVSIGRAGLMASLAMGLSYDLQRKKNIPVRLFTQYQLWFQTPFAKSYVPVLPNATLHIGSAFYFSGRTQ